MLLDDHGLQERVARMETLLEQIETLKDPYARSKAAEVVGVLLDLYGDGLARMMDLVYETGNDKAFESFARDELVSHLLLLHGLHPLDVETRVVQALEEVRPYLQSHGGNVEFLGVEGGVARLRMQGSCDGCPSSAMTLKLAIEEAVLKAAPDLDGIEAEGVAEAKPAPNIVAGPTLRRKEKKQQPEEDGVAWTVVGGLPQLTGGGMLAKEVSGEPVLFVKLANDLYAYRNLCPDCGGSLEGGNLRVAELSCPGCEHRYDVRRAGRCLDAPQLHLEPIPLLETEIDVEEREGTGQRSIVKIAQPSAVS
ncbi:MAG: NifU family protein [Actinomycetota bacterium]|jgi:Fe-S cluster biogenesis protein NfuA/nitrite reductase/ring-hydroxylating ferredoxin subunit|nr:NifU family protein [Actinomycetota bacterium]